ncbi:MAG: zinc-binding dehydrogenase, partial [Christensenellaceae bacterium]|nr:zinc-binding dehydrogenase [Christensenellaceae bacterium]
PRRVVVTGTSAERLERARKIFCGKKAQEAGVEVCIVATGDCATPAEAAERILAANEGKGFDDVLVNAPVRMVVETASMIAGQGCCINFFAGPTDPKLSATVNFYDVHYAGVHYVGTSGGSSLDMKEAIDMISAGQADPAVMLTHVGGLNAAIPSLLELPHIPGGKKLIYNDIDLPLTAIDEFKNMSGFEKLSAIIDEADGLWSPAAEEELLRVLKK